MWYHTFFNFYIFWLKNVSYIRISNLSNEELLAEGIWEVLFQFGENRSNYEETLAKLRRSYCPSFTANETIQKDLKAVHFSFEEYFVAMLMEMCGGQMDYWMIMTLRSLFLNPYVKNFLILSITMKKIKFKGSILCVFSAGPIYRHI